MAVLLFMRVILSLILSAICTSLYYIDFKSTVQVTINAKKQQLVQEAK